MSKIDIKRSMYWADQVARKILTDRNKKRYTIAAAVTPSGTIHIGNFREIITADIVTRALKDLGKEVRFIYTWDDYDRLRKVPRNVPKRKELEKYMYMPIVDVPDPWRCHKSYAFHFEKEIEDVLPAVGIKPEIIRNSESYKDCKYAKEIKDILNKRKTIRNILNRYRKEPLPKDYYPLVVYCEKCKKELTKIIEWDGSYRIKYKCRCGFENEIDFRKKCIVKLPWRVDWPMKWHREGVDFEPGGKEHSTPGGSRTTGEKILRAVWNMKPPVYLMYDYIIVKGIGGKMSSSLGNVITLKEILRVYLPEIVRFLFAGTKPRKEFAVSLDEDVVKIYEDFYEVERAYFGKEDADEKTTHQKIRIYEMSVVDKPPKTLPIQPGFRYCSDLINVYKDINNVLRERAKDMNKLNRERFRAVLERAKYWLEHYAPDKYKFEVQKKVPINIKLSNKQKAALKSLAKRLKEKDWNEDSLLNLFYEISRENELSPRNFFTGAYKVLINREYGPKLTTLILVIGKKKVVGLLEKL